MSLAIITSYYVTASLGLGLLWIVFRFGRAAGFADAVDYLKNQDSLPARLWAYELEQAGRYCDLDDEGPSHLGKSGIFAEYHNATADDDRQADEGEQGAGGSHSESPFQGGSRPAVQGAAR